MIAVTGANGNLGKATIRFLLQKISPSNIVAIARNSETIKDFRAQGIIVRQADYNDYDTLKRAFKNVEKVLQVSTIGADIKTAMLQEENVVNAMIENRVKYVAYTSMVKAKPDSIFQGTATQYHTEELIRASKIPYTFFRNSMYMEAIPELIGDALETGEIRYPSGNGKISFVSRQDIAESIANVLTENGHENKTYEITGSHAYTFTEVANILSILKNKKICHSDIPEPAFRSELVDYQMSLQVVDLLVSMAKGIKAGEFSYTADTLEKLLKRKPLSLDEFLKKF